MIADAEAQAELALRHGEGLVKAAGGILDGVHAHVGAQVIVDLAPGQGDEGVRAGGGDPPGLGCAAVEDLHRGGLEKIAVKAGELHIAHRGGVFLRAHVVAAVVLIAAHLLDEAVQGVRALVVDAGADVVDELVFLTVHIVAQQQPAAHGRGEQHFAQKLGHGL